ncbi:MAG TPA: glycosyltransferase [Solirubrobacteraceae bacterium]|nr:glycosyltransferase [Solirubrobacteraceae bacterium]
MSARVALIADAGSQAGLGHLARCSGIALALRCREVETSCYSYAAPGPQSVDGVCWHPFQSPGELSLPPSTELTLVDSYRLGLDQFEPLARGSRLAVIRDHGPLLRQADLTIDPASPNGARQAGQLLGLAYIPLRPAYWGLPPREPRETVSRVLVTTGSGVSPGAGGELAGMAQEALPGAQVVLVVGPYAHPDAPSGVELVVAPASLLAEMMRADLVVSAAGQTMLEATAVGTPCVALVLFDNQQRNATLLEGLGAVRVVRSVGPELARALRELAENTEARRQMSQHGQAAVDGYGAHRIAFEIERLLLSSGAR